MKKGKKLCNNCSPIKYEVDLKGKGRSVGIEMIKCDNCNKVFERPTLDEPLIRIKD